MGAEGSNDGVRGVGRGWTPYRVLLGAIVVQLILGTVYGYSIFWQPLAAEVFPEVVTQAEAAARGIAPGAAVADGAPVEVVADDAARDRRVAEQQGLLTYAFSICILSFAAVMVLAGRVQDATGPRIPALIGGAMMGAGFLIAGLSASPVIFLLGHAGFVGAVTIVLVALTHAVAGRVDPERWPLAKAAPYGVAAAAVVAGVLIGDRFVGRLGEFDRLLVIWGSIGFLAGAGIGFAYVCPIAALVKWFPRHKGLVSGLAVAGFGFGAYLFKGQAIGALGFIEREGITAFFLVHAVVCFVGVSIGALLLRNPPDPGAPGASSSPGAPDTPWHEVLRRPAFYLIWLMFFSGAMAGLMVIGIVKVFAGERLVGAAAASGAALADAEVEGLLLKGAEAVGWLALFNAVGRIAWGFVSDRVGRTAAFIAMFLAQAAIMFTLGAMETELSLAVAAAIVGFNFGGNFALFPSATADLFGSRSFGVNYALVFTSYGVAGVVGIAAGNAAKATTGSYTAAFVAAGALCVLSAALAVALGRLARRAHAPAA